MAKYTINHICGHSRTVALLGKTSEREKKIEWLEGQECPACWGKKKREAEALKPITATICMNGLDTDEHGHVLAEIALTGGTEPKKEEIKKLGYRWGEMRGGVMNMLLASKSKYAWIKRVKLDVLTNEELTKPISEEFAALGAQVVFQFSALDVEMAAQKQAKKIEQDKEIAKLEKPTKPACYPTGQWNGVVYGKAERGYRIYVDNVETEISSEEAKAILAYSDARKAYREKVEKIKNEK